MYRLLKGEDIINEEPGIKEIDGTWWKGKADCINKDQGLLVDIKTTGDINKFKKSPLTYITMTHKRTYIKRYLVTI